MCIPDPDGLALAMPMTRKALMCPLAARSPADEKQVTENREGNCVPEHSQSEPDRRNGSG